MANNSPSQIELIIFNNTLCVNFEGHGQKYKEIMIQEFAPTINNNIQELQFMNGESPLIPTYREISIDLSIVAKDMEIQNKPYNFKEILQSELKIEDLFKLINKKINKQK